MCYVHVFIFFSFEMQLHQIHSIEQHKLLQAFFFFSSSISFCLLLLFCFSFHSVYLFFLFGFWNCFTFLLFDQNLFFSTFPAASFTLLGNCYMVVQHTMHMTLPLNNNKSLLNNDQIEKRTGTWERQRYDDNNVDEKFNKDALNVCAFVFVCTENEDELNCVRLN